MNPSPLRLRFRRVAAPFLAMLLATPAVCITPNPRTRASTHDDIRRTSSQSASHFQTTPDGAAQPANVALVEGETVRNVLRGGAAQSLSVTLAAGQFAQILFMWRGFDLSVSASGPGGVSTSTPPIPIRAPGPASVSFIADTAGEHRFEVRPLDGLKVDGWYEVRLAAVRQPTATDELRLKAERALAEGNNPSAPTSKEKIEEALRLWQSAGDLSGQAAALSALAELNRSQDFQTAVEQYRAAASLRHQLNDTAAEAHTLIDLGNAYRKAERREEALESFGQALALFRGAHDRTGEARALYNIGFALALAGQYREAVTHYEQALAIQTADGDRPREATTLNALGGVQDRLGNYDAALSFYRRAAGIRLELGDRLTGALLLNNMSALNVTLGNWQEAKEGYESVLSVYESFVGKGLKSCGAARSEQEKTTCRYAAYTLDNLGELYITLGDPQAALTRLEQSYSMHAALDDAGGQGLARAHTCYSTLLQGRPREALKFCEEALLRQTPPGEQAPKVDPPRAYTLTVMGMVYDALGETAQARSRYERAAEFHHDRGDKRAEAITLDKAGASLARARDAKGASEKFDAALALWREIRDRDGEALTLYNAARAEEDRGDLVAAHRHIDEALGIIESLRVKVTAQRLRASYFAQKADYYELAIDLKMQLAKAGGLGVATPAELAASALQTSERARARVLFDILAEARVETRDGSDAVLDELLTRRQELQHRLDYKAVLQTRLLAVKTPSDELTTVENELAQLVADYDDVDAQVRARSPRYAELTKPQPLSAAEIQSQLLDEQTILLEYALGERRSYLWVVSQSGIKWFELPGREEIEESARSVLDIVGDEQKQQDEREQPYQLRLAGLERRFRKEATRLSRMLLGPAAAELGHKRLLVVAGGELQQLPFAALPSPEAAGAENGAPPLEEEHEIVGLPSASTLAALRAMTQKRPRPPKAVAVLADPVFQQDDSRLRKTLERQANPALPTAQPRTVEAALGFDAKLARLAASGEEAEAIKAATFPAATMIARDFAANRTTVNGAELRRHRIVHFATHAIFNDKQPELSSVVLSLFDETGQPREDGFLRLHDVYNLDLPVDMVVLSACQTARGKQVRSEGLIGLTRGFMYAGAPRVVASLWKVEDEATAELMRLFYLNMFRDNMSPPAALRQAQMSLRRQRGRSAPYYWAGFVLQGEWK